MEKVEVIQLGIKLMVENGLKNWDFALDTAKRSFGRCWYSKKLITISEDFIAINNFEQIKETILHEIAHAISFEKYNNYAHNSIWKKIALDIGSNGRSVYTSIEVSMPRLKEYIYECPYCKKEFIKTYLMRKSKRACWVCCRRYSGGKFNSNYVLKLKGERNG